MFTIVACGAGTAYHCPAPEFSPFSTFYAYKGCSCCSFGQITCLQVFGSVLWWTLPFFALKPCSVRLYFHLFCRNFMLYFCYLYVCTLTGFKHVFYVRCCSCRLTVTRRVSHVEQELLILTEHMNSPPVFSGVCIAWYVVLSVVIFR